jgi:hypothetical protein
MNYKIINNSIISGKDFLIGFKKDRKFYDYLFNNNVAYYYSKVISKDKNPIEEDIIKRGDKINQKYYKTLKLINLLCKKNNIPFLLYKTHKYIPEVVDGDIDLFVKEIDFYKFMRIFREEGFKCIEDEPKKGKCIKEGYCVIEPHINIGWRENLIINQKIIWNHFESIKIGGIKFKKCSRNLDIFSIFLELFWEPNYLKLYDLLVIKRVQNSKQISSLTNDIILRNQIDIIFNLLINNELLIKNLPFFLPNNYFINWWFKYIALNNEKTFSFKIKHLIYFVYWKYRYKIINKLPFRHYW